MLMMSEPNNFNRLVKLLARGGTMVLRRLLCKCTAPVKVSDYFYQNQGCILKLKLTQKQRQLLTGREIDKMDITLLCKLILDLFKDNLTDKEKSGIKAIRTERDNLMHSEILETAKLSTQVFEKRWQELSALLGELAHEFETELQECIDETKRSDPDFLEIYETLKDWCQSNTELQELQEKVDEKVDALARSVEELKVTQTQFDKKIPTKLDGLKDKFKCHYEYSNTLDIQLTQKMVEAKDNMSRSYSVILYGGPGEGKTTAAFRIVKCLVDEEIVKLERCAMIYESDDLKEIQSKDVDLLFIDDTFGKHNAEQSKLVAWRSFFPTLQSFIGSRKMRVMFASRKHIYLEYKRELDEFVIFSRTVELTSSELSPEEKKHILLSQLKANNRDINEINVDECICQKDTVAGFPLCAQQFASDLSLFEKKAAFFAKPYKYFLENIQNLDDQSFIALLFVLYKGNKLPTKETDITKMSESSQKELVKIARLCGIEKTTSAIVKETKQKLIHMKDTYLKCIDNTFSFYHDTMYEAVAKLHGQEYPSEVITHCTIDYLCQCIRLEDEANEGIIVIEKGDFKTLAGRCIAEVIENENGRRLSKHPIFENQQFIQEIIRVVTEREETFEDFFSKGLSFDYVGIHAFLFHIMVNCQEYITFFREVRPCLKCSHAPGFEDSCWKCKVKSEALTGICSINRKDLYIDLRTDAVEVTTFCLYKAVENEDVDPDFVELIIYDLNQAGKYIVDHYDLQFCLGMSLKHKERQILNILKGSGLHFTTKSMYFAVKCGDEELISSLLDVLINEKRWEPDDIYVSRAVTEAHATGKDRCLHMLFAAGAKLTDASVAWAIIDHGFEEVQYVIQTLKENDNFDPESMHFSESMAMAMKNDDERIYQLLDDEGVIPTTALVRTLSEIGHDANDIKRIIEELKTHGRWNAYDTEIAQAYMVSCKRSDKTLTDILEKEGAGISPACLPSVVKECASEIDNVLKTLKNSQKLDPSDNYIASAFVSSIEHQDKTVYHKLVSEGLCLTMSCLPAAVFSTMNTLEFVTAGLKKEDKWNINDDYAVNALNMAYNKHDKAAYDFLITEGIEWSPRNLYVAVYSQTDHNLKQIVKEMRRRGLLDPSCEDINNAVL